MTVIRVHFDGRHIVPDEPISLPARSHMILLVDSDDGPAAAQLDKLTREYYESQPAEDAADDAAWGRGVTPDSRQAWDQE